MYLNAVTAMEGLGEEWRTSAKDSGNRRVVGGLGVGKEWRTRERQRELETVDRETSKQCKKNDKTKQKEKEEWNHCRRQGIRGIYVCLNSDHFMVYLI